jgi:hypothetical protein
MDKKQLLEMTKALLIKAQKDGLKKDDMPHPANSPEDKAHDIVEEDESIKQALAILDTPEKQAKMFEHLRSLSDKESLRSPENQEAGKEMEKSAIEIVKGLLKKSQENPAEFEEMAKALMPAPATPPAAPKGTAKAPAAKMPKAPKMPKSPAAPAPQMMKEEKKEKKEEMEKCGPMKMSKEEIKEDLKKEWKPKFKKESK